MNTSKKILYLHKFKPYIILSVIASIIIFIALLLNIINNKYISKTVNTNPEVLKIHYIDVGQGDSILVQINNINMLIDSGPKSSNKKILNYLKLQNIKKIDYLILTHPHEDHIGNIPDIIQKYNVEKFYSPKITSTSKLFESTVDNLKNKNLKINVIKEGTDSINLGSNTNISVLTPISKKYDNLNNYSPIIKLTYKNNSFLFTGDAEELSEEQVLNKQYNLKSDVLKIGHHGSNSSTSRKFLDKVNPSIAVISVGQDNDFSHPNKDVLSLLKSKNINIFRTDLNGNIVIYSDGNSISVVSSKSE